MTLRLALIGLALLALLCGVVQGDAPSSLIDCQNALPSVKTALDAELARFRLPEVAYECSRRGQLIDVTMNTIIVGKINVTLLSTPGYLAQVVIKLRRELQGEWTGTGPDATRHAESPYLTSETAEDLSELCKLDTGAWLHSIDPISYPADYIPDARIGGGPLSFLQCIDELDVCVGQLGGASWNHYFARWMRSNFLISFSPSNCSMLSYVKWEDLSTIGTRWYANQPENSGKYNLTLVNNWTRDVVHYPTGSFGPSLVFKAQNDEWYVLTGDANPSYPFQTPQMYRGQVNPYSPEIKGFIQRNGGPVIDEKWGVTQDSLHHVSNKFYLLKLKTFEHVRTDVFADNGEGTRADARTPTDGSSQGRIDVWCGWRMPLLIQKKNGELWFQTSSSFLDTLLVNFWLVTDADADRVAIAVKNGNVNHQRHGVRKVYKLITNSSGVFFEFKFKYYSGPPDFFGPIPAFPGDTRPPFAGHIHPKLNRTFIDDYEADLFNYRADGLWSKSNVYLPDLDLIVGTGPNGFEVEEDYAIAVYNATGTIDPVTGGLGQPQKPWIDFEIELYESAHKTSSKLQQWHYDIVRTEDDRGVSVMQKVGKRGLQHLAEATYAVNGTTGEFEWIQKHRWASAWMSGSFIQFAAFNETNPMPRKSQVNLALEDCDCDNAVGAVYDAETNAIIVASKDGTLESLDPKTGKRRWTNRVGLPVAEGSVNYDITVVRGKIVGISKNSNTFGYYFGCLTHRTVLDANFNAQTTFIDEAYAQKLMEVPFPTKTYVEPPRVRLINPYVAVLWVVDAYTGEIEHTVGLNEPEQALDLLNYLIPFSMGISSVSDALIVPAGASNMLRLYSLALDILYEQDALLELNTVVPGLNQTHLYMNMPWTPLKSKIVGCKGETFYSGKTGGKLCSSLQIKPHNSTVAQQKKRAMQQQQKSYSHPKNVDNDPQATAAMVDQRLKTLDAAGTGRKRFNPKGDMHEQACRLENICFN